MRGHIAKKQGPKGRARYYIVLDLPQHPAQRCDDCERRAWIEGKPLDHCDRCGGAMGEVHPERRQKWTGGFTTKRAAEKELSKLLTKLDRDEDPFFEKITFGEYAGRWIDGLTLRPRTIEGYRRLLRDDILPILFGVELRKIKPAHVRAVLDRMRDRGLAASTMRQARAVMGSCLRQALEDGLVSVNVVSAVKRPRGERPELKVPTRDQLSALMEAAASDDVWGIPILLASTTGARRSETLAVKWTDLDLGAGKLTIQRGLQHVPDGKGGRPLRITEPKTKQAIRTVVLLPFVVDRLRFHRKAQNERRIAYGGEWVDKDLICERGDGEWLDPDSFTKAFKRIAREAGLDPESRLHDLRHAVASELGRAGVHPVIVSQIVGHSSPSFTMSCYQHAWSEGAAEAARALQEAFEQR